jgi:hypothetical protein
MRAASRAGALFGLWSSKTWENRVCRSRPWFLVGLVFMNKAPQDLDAEKKKLEIEDLKRKQKHDDYAAQSEKLGLEIEDLKRRQSWDEYDLRIDQQVQKFLDLKHKIVFFLITASIGSIAYTLNFSANRLSQFFEHPWRAVSLVAGAIVGLSAAGCALYSLHQEIKSYQFHLGARYSRQRFDDLSDPEKKTFDQFNKRAAFFQAAAFVLLIASVSLQAILFMLFIF